jgi:hypothetical protein
MAVTWNTFWNAGSFQKPIGSLAQPLLEGYVTQPRAMGTLTLSACRSCSNVSFGKSQSASTPNGGQDFGGNYRYQATQSSLITSSLGKNDLKICSPKLEPIFDVQ